MSNEPTVSDTPGGEDEVVQETELDIAIEAPVEEVPAEESVTEASAEEAALAAEPASEAEEKAENPNMKWYVVQAYSMYEKRVQQSIKDAVAREGLDEFFGEVLVPTEEVVEMKGGQKRTSERKFFPGYVLVQMEVNDRSWHLINSLPKVSGFVGGKQGDPVPLSEKEANAILQRMSDSADAPRPKFTFSPGEVVRVIDGPFADFSGAVEEVDFEKSRLKVSVMIFGRSTPVELGFDQVEKG